MPEATCSPNAMSTAVFLRQIMASNTSTLRPKLPETWQAGCSIFESEIDRTAFAGIISTHKFLLEEDRRMRRFSLVPLAVVLCLPAFAAPDNTAAVKKQLEADFGKMMEAF